MRSYLRYTPHGVKPSQMKRKEVEAMINFDKKIDFQQKKNNLLTVGEILIDMISTDYGDRFEGDTYRRFFGGSPSNIAINTKRLGINSTVASAVGNDGLGDYLVNYLRQANIDLSFIQQVD